VSSGDDIRPWRLQWRPEHIERFWNWYASNPTLADTYFSKMVGNGVLEDVGGRIRLKGTIVDLGAGPGYLVEHLLRWPDVQVLAVDVSTQSVEMLRQRFAGNPKFLGALVSTPHKVPVSDARADIAFLLETVEHLTDDVLVPILGEAQRVLRSGGYVVVTTPNEENLEASESMCPNCGCVFHRIQHVRAWTAASLIQKMREIGFIEVFCEPTFFSIYPQRLIRRLQLLKWRLARRALPNLLYIGKKPQSPES
jgi:SAM-dependent methyltransferase